MKFLKVISLMSLALLLASCSVKHTKKYVLTPGETLDIVIAKKDIIAPQRLADIVLFGSAKYRFVDLRTPHEYLVSHLKNAVNVPFKDVLDDEYSYILNQDEVINVLYGSSPEQVADIYLLLKQLNYKNLRMALGNYDYIHHNIIERYGIYSGNYYDEKARYDYAKIVAEIAGSGSAPTTTSAPKTKKKVIKRKKKEVAGGCG